MVSYYLWCVSCIKLEYILLCGIFASKTIVYMLSKPSVVGKGHTSVANAQSGLVRALQWLTGACLIES